MKEVVLCGAGGHAKSVLHLLRLLGYTVPYILDEDFGTVPSVNGVPVRGPLSLLPDREDVFAFLAIADNQKREEVAARFRNVNWVTLVHPAAWIDPSARLGAGSYVAAGAIVNAEAVLGNHVIVDSGASVGHDCIVEDFVQLESGVRMGGGAYVSRGALCEIGSAVIPNCSIGAGARLGPRAVAIRPVPAGASYAGVPAKPAQDRPDARSPEVDEAGTIQQGTGGHATERRRVTILISSAGRRVELIRCFRADAKSLGLELRVVAVDVDPEMSSACQAADKCYGVAPCGSPEFLSDLLHICEREEVKLLVPTIDPELSILAEQRQKFEALGTRPLVSSPAVVRIARDKFATAEFLRRNGLPAPRTARIRELLRHPDALTWPTILKPAHGSASIGICVARNIEEAAEVAKNREDYVAQELLKGREFTVNLFFDKNGKLRSAVPHERCEVRAGEVSKGTTRRESRLLDLAWRLGSVLEGAVGVFCFQAMMPEGGEPIVFEINARFGGGYPVAHQAGATFTKWLLEEVTGLPSSANDCWDDGLTMLRYDAAVFRRNGAEK